MTKIEAQENLIGGLKQVPFRGRIRHAVHSPHPFILDAGTSLAFRHDADTLSIVPATRVEFCVVKALAEQHVIGFLATSDYRCHKAEQHETAHDNKTDPTTARLALLPKSARQMTSARFTRKRESSHVNGARLPN